MESGKWQVASCKLKVISGKWQVASGKLKVASGKLQVAGEPSDGNGKLQVASCKWQVASGKWQVASCKWQMAGEPSDGTNFGSTANPGIGSQFGQTKFLAIHSASLAKNKVVK